MAISSFYIGPDNKRIIDEKICSFYIGPDNKRILDFFTWV